MANQNKFDHIKLGKHLRHFVYPPTMLPETSGFEDGLRESSLTKIKELLDRAEVLKRDTIASAENIKANTVKGSVSEFFFKTFAAHEFAEYFVIRKWLRYWVEIWRKVSNKPLPIRLTNKMNHYGYFEVQQARHVPLERLYGGKLRKVGSRLTGLCPLHEEKTPSFIIYEDTNTYHCFGCGAHGDAIEFIEKTKGLDFPEAMKYLL